MRQFVYAMFITNNHASFRLWWKEKYQKVSKYYVHDCSPIGWKFLSVKFCSAFFTDLENQLVANMEFLKSTYQTMILSKFKRFLMHKKVPLLSSCMKGYCQKNVIFCYFLPTSALFQKTFSIKWHSLRKSHANFRHVASRGKSYAIFIDSSPIRWKFCSLKFWSAFLINLEKQLVVNTDFMKKNV